MMVARRRLRGVLIVLGSVTVTVTLLVYTNVTCSGLCTQVFGPYVPQKGGANNDYDITPTDYNATVLGKSAVSNSSGLSPYSCQDIYSGSPTRDILWQEKWPEREQSHSKPYEIMPIVHYVWCEKKPFQLHHYLGLLSAIRVLHPAKIIFHHTDQPTVDNYHTWFPELVKTFADLELRPISHENCKPTGTPDNVLRTLLSAVFKDNGGVFMGEGMVLALPPDFPGDARAWVAADPGSADPTKIIVAIKSGVELQPLLDSLAGSLSAPTPPNSSLAGSLSASPPPNSSSSTTVISTRCATVPGFTATASCVALESKIYPQDFMTATSAFAELARWLFYGRRQPVRACRDPSNPIPRLAHYIKVKPSNQGQLGYGSAELTFNHFLSIISALYVGGFERVYLHTDQRPTGRWWEELSKENVTLVPVNPLHFVFQQEIGVVQHVSDVLRVQILGQYGGAYQDFDVVWVSRVPDWLLEFPAVLGMEWVKANADFPEVFNNGVFMARAGSPFLRHYIKTYADFRDKDWAYNSLLMSFRTYELYPETLYLDRHLQVLCWTYHIPPPSLCHPAWERGYVRDIDDRSATLRIRDWKTEVRAFHITGPKPHPSFSSPEILATRKGFFSAIGQYILERSGRLHLLKSPP